MYQCWEWKKESKRNGKRKCKVTEISLPKDTYKGITEKNEDMKSEGLLITYKYHRKWNQKEESSYSIETENKTKITHNRLN